MTGWAADFSSAQLSAAQLKASGYQGAVRYITGQGKQITGVELADLTTTPGMALALVNETYAQAASGGYSIGRAEAQAAFTRADQLGWPRTRPIYFVLEDPRWISPPWPILEEYLRGVLTVVSPSRVGDYGSARQIAHMMAIGLCTYGWAVETWPGDHAPTSPNHLVQMYNPIQGAPHNFGGNVDPDMILKDDWGQWSAVTPAPTPAPAPAPTPEVLNMAVVQIGDQEQRFSVDGAGNLIHRWYVPPPAGSPSGTQGVWHREVRQSGCVPHGPVDIDPHYVADGFFHIYADKADGTQAHSFWDGKAWSDEVNP